MASRDGRVGYDGVEWGFDGTAVQATPAIDLGRVFVGSRDGGLYALGLATGERLWRVDYGAPWVVSSVAVGDGRVYTGSSDGEFIQAVDAATGAEIWTRELGARVFASPALSGSALYAADHASRVHALDATTGEPRWTLRLADQIQSSPVPAGESLFVGADDGALYALAPTLAPARLAVFWDSTLAPFAVQPGGPLLRKYLAGHDYEVLDAPALARWLAERTQDRAPSAVVFALDHLPAAVGPGIRPER